MASVHKSYMTPTHHKPVDLLIKIGQFDVESKENSFIF